MKKIYQKPAMLVMEMNTEQTLLAASYEPRLRVSGLDDDFGYDDTEGNGWDAW